MEKYTYQDLLDIIEKNGRYSQCVPLVNIMFSIENETGKTQNWDDTAPDWVAELFKYDEKIFIYCDTDSVFMQEEDQNEK